MKYKVGDKLLCHKQRGIIPVYEIGKWYDISLCSFESVFVKYDDRNGCWFNADKYDNNNWMVFSLCDYFYSESDIRRMKLDRINCNYESIL